MAKIFVERSGAITTIVMNRPEVRNALDNEAIELLGDAFRAFEADQRAIRMQGETLGRAVNDVGSIRV